MLENVDQRTIKPILPKTIPLGTNVFTDEYDSTPASRYRSGTVALVPRLLRIRA